jgi:adenosylmethionine-8-amino-7-oxononanoate aminotransferase
MICNIGHGDERVKRAMLEQAERVSFAYRTQFENEAAVNLSRMLVEQTSERLSKVFFVSGGSEAVEAAMKLCRQYLYNKGEGSRHIFISRQPCYHGASLGALSLTTYSPLEIPFRPMLKPYPKVPAPYYYRSESGKTLSEYNIDCAKALERTILEQGPDNVAAFVAEPVGGASVGALVPSDEYFPMVREICDKYGILLIFDEVMTGFGRTGEMFGYKHWGVEPDIMALSKGMASGYYPLGAIMADKEIVDVVIQRGGFAHGHTYCGNPLACAVGCAVVDIIVNDKLSENAAAMGEVLMEGLKDLRAKHPIIGEARGLGLLTAIELVQDAETREPFPARKNVNLKLTDEAFARGLIIYPRRCINGLAGDHVLVAPPLIVNKEQIGEIISRLDDALSATEAKL